MFVSVRNQAESHVREIMSWHGQWFALNTLQEERLFEAIVKLSVQRAVADDLSLDQVVSMVATVCFTVVQQERYNPFGLDEPGFSVKPATYLR